MDIEEFEYTRRVITAQRRIEVKIMVPEKVKAYAKKHGFSLVKRIGKYEKYNVYIPYFEPVDGIVPPTGLPVCILEKNGSLTWVTGKDAFTILDEF